MSKRADTGQAEATAPADDMPDAACETAPVRGQRHRLSERVGGGARIVGVAGGIQTLTRELEDILKRDSRPLTLDSRDKVNIRSAIEALHIMRSQHAHDLEVYATQACQLVDLRIRLQTAEQGMRDLLEVIT